MENPHLEQLGTEEFNGRLMATVVRMPFEVLTAHDNIFFVKRGEAAPETLLDYWNDEGVCSLGYNSGELVMAVKDFLETGAPHQLPDVYPHRFRWEAAEALTTRMGLDRAFFANSGAEANEAAIKIARKYWHDRGEPERDMILTVEGNFHGRTGFSLAASDSRVSPHHAQGFGPLPQGFGVLHWTGEEFTQAVTDGVEHRSPTYVNWLRVAAVILAPVLGNNLVRTYAPSFWETLHELADKWGFLIIHDDVQAGCGRAGHYASWRVTSNRKPDILTLGKGLAMGFPMSAMLAREGVAKAFTPGVHFNTFGGSPFVCYMAIQMMKWLDKNLSAVGEKGELIRAWFEKTWWIGHHDGAGLLNAFTPQYARYNYSGYRFCQVARDRGLGLITHREYGPIRFIPCLNTPAENIQQALDMLTEVHAEVCKEVCVDYRR